MEIYSIYILYSEKSDRYYVGYSHDVERRFLDHNQGDRVNQSTKYTFKHRPWKLMAKFPVGESRSLALKVERYIKRQKSRKFIQSLIENQNDQEKIAQLVRVPMNRD